MDSKQGGAERKGLLDMLYGYSERGCASYITRHRVHMSSISKA
jgi:hypothetical protein